MGEHASEHLEDLARLGADLFHAAFPDVPASAAVRLRPVPSRGWHRMALVQQRGDRRCRLLLKMLSAEGSADAERWARMMATEYRLLTEVAPRISDADPAIGCPRAFAYRPTPGVLALEVVEGPMLSTVLFGLRRRPEARRARQLLEQCGEWLARFHALTRTGGHGNPFEWLHQEFGRPEVTRVFLRHGEERLHAEIRAVAAGLLDAYWRMRVPTCTVHGVFAPYHVIVQGERIRVIDLESAHVGYPYLDLVLFDAYAAFRLPWARAIASARLPFLEQRRALLDGYTRQAGPFGASERAGLGLARVHALVRFALEWERVPGGTWPKRGLRSRWWRRCLRHVWVEEAPALCLAARGAPLPASR